MGAYDEALAAPNAANNKHLPGTVVKDMFGLIDMQVGTVVSHSNGGGDYDEYILVGDSRRMFFLKTSSYRLVALTDVPFPLEVMDGYMVIE